MDDALSTRQLPNGQIEVGVHIADVSHFVRKVLPSKQPLLLLLRDCMYMCARQSFQQCLVQLMCVLAADDTVILTMHCTCPTANRCMQWGAKTLMQHGSTDTADHA